MSPEILEVNDIKQLSFKSDIYSLGLSLFEILAKIDLPQNGEGWRFIRSENFILTKDYFKNSNLKDVKDLEEFIKLIKDLMELNPNKRKDLDMIISEYNELAKRYSEMLNGAYNRKAKDFAQATRPLVFERTANRSDSFKSTTFHF